MQPRLEILKEKKLIGIRMKMSISDNKTGELWRTFMPRRKEISHSIGTELFSMQRYNPTYFTHFNPQTEFEKWAAVEVSAIESIPEGMESIMLDSGLYAVFHYKGPSTAGAQVFQYILGTWLPNSEYQLDDRFHFEILGEKYRNNSSDSEEEIWIPIRLK